MVPHELLATLITNIQSLNKTVTQLLVTVHSEPMALYEKDALVLALNLIVFQNASQESILDHS